MKTVTMCFGIAVLATGCGGSSNEESTFSGGPGSGSGGNGGSSILVQDAATFGEASADGSIVMPGDDCPATPPAKGSACTAALTCTYDACATTGATTATCDGKTWTLATAACAAMSCPAGGSQQCTAGQICLAVQMATTVGHGCIANPCGEGPLTCRCVVAKTGNQCSGGCTGVVGHEVQCVQ